MDNKPKNINVLAIDTSTEAYSVACCSYQIDSNQLPSSDLHKSTNSTLNSDNCIISPQISQDLIINILHKIEIIDHFAIAPCKHSQQILPAIQECMQKCNLQFSDLTCLAFAHGPGSFTGLRLATSVIHGLALAHNVPIVKISTLRAIAQEAHDKHQAQHSLVALDARMNEIYFGIYQVSTTGLMFPLTEDILIAPHEIDIKNIISQYEKHFINDIIGIGNAWNVYKDILYKQDLKDLSTIIENDCYPQARYVLKLAIYEYMQNNFVDVDDALPLYLRNNVVHVKANNTNTNK